MPKFDVAEEASTSKPLTSSGWSSSSLASPSTPIASSSRIPAASHTSDVPPSTASPNPPKKQLQGWKHSIAGSIGGMAGAIVTSPFDVVKTRLQSDLFRHHAGPSTSSAASSVSNGAMPPRPRVSGGLYQFVDTIQLIRRIGVEEGWRALYKGLGPSLVGIIPARAINFYFYPTSKHYLARQFPNAPTTQAGQTAEDSPLIHLSAAVIAGIMTATGTNPIWVVKTRLQLSARSTGAKAAPSIPTPSPASPLPKVIGSSAAALARGAPAAATASVIPPPKITPVNAIGTALQIIKQEGIPGLYRGLSASYLGVSEGVIQWVLYERLKRLNKPASPDQPTSLLSYTANIVGASGTAKAVASLITYPHEVVRTRLRQPNVGGRQKYTGLVQTLKLVVAEEGARALYGGLTAHLLRVVPNAACMFLIYEVVANRLA